MGTVYFHGIKANPLRVTSTLGKGGYHIVDISGGHGVAINLTRDIHAGRGVSIDVTLGEYATLAHAANMPKLRRNLPALGVNRLDNALPARQSIIAVNIGNARVSTGRNVIDTGPLGHDETDTACSALTVVLNISIRWDIFGRLIPRHGRHHHTIVKF
jgi:hypothetical protein